MIQNLADCLWGVTAREGGFVNDPQDSGGATNHGVTQHEYDHWRALKGLPLRSVRLIEDAEVEAIYKQLYWDACSCSDLPDGLDYAVFDFAVNSGPFKAASVLQQIVGAHVDGHIGPVTIFAVYQHEPRDLVAALCDARVVFLKGLKNYPHFGKGWLRRVSEVEIAAKVLAG